MRPDPVSSDPRSCGLSRRLGLESPTYAGAYHRDGLPVGPDGSFRVDSMPPGDYFLGIWVFGPAVGKPSNTAEPFAAGFARIEISPAWDAGGEGPPSLGTIDLRKTARK